jgi:DNA-binding NtrC family response regulator
MINAMDSFPEMRRVLVVDDEKVIADSLTAILCASGYLATAAYSASGAMIAAGNLIPDMLISDVLMPDVNGIELADYFAEHHPECSIMLMSGDSATSDLVSRAALQGQPHFMRNKLMNPAHILEMLATFAPTA